MAAVTPPAFLQAGSYAAQVARQLMQDFIKDTTGASLSSIEGGAISSTDIKVVQLVTPAKSIRVLFGYGYVRGTSVSNQGAYRIHNDADVVKPIAANSSGSTRNDLIIARVYDHTHDGLGQNMWAVEVVQGTPGAGDPTVPGNNFMKLARVTCANNFVSIADSSITDLRKIVLLGAGTTVGTEFAEWFRSADYGSKVQFGTQNYNTPVGLNNTTVVVTFPTVFATAPKVYVTQASTPPEAVLNIIGQTTTDFTVRAIKPDQTNYTAAQQCTLHWWAVGT